MDTSRLHEVKAPQHFKTRRSRLGHVPVEFGLRRVAVGRVPHLDRRHYCRNPNEDVFATKGLAFVIICQYPFNYSFSLHNKIRLVAARRRFRRFRASLGVVADDQVLDMQQFCLVRCRVAEFSVQVVRNRRVDL